MFDLISFYGHSWCSGRRFLYHYYRIIIILIEFEDISLRKI